VPANLEFNGAARETGTVKSSLCVSRLQGPCGREKIDHITPMEALMRRIVTALFVLLVPAAATGRAEEDKIHSPVEARKEIGN
jgi:hypothetical protein